MADEKFQVNLKGVIDLLSDHLYSTPLVFVRELLQNGVDAIAARRTIEPEHQGTVRIELGSGSDSDVSTLSIVDDGIGLTAEDVKVFLATIGNSSKRDAIAADDYIGQFGIGLLSCFVVTDEIVMITRSAKEAGKAIQWRGRADGSYDTSEIDSDIDPGTHVFLRSTPESNRYFEPEVICNAARAYGQHLRASVTVETDGTVEQINNTAPWEFESKTQYLDYGQREFEIDFLDAFPINSLSGKVDGVAYVLPFSSNTPQQQPHRVYLKGMLLSEKGDDLLPLWAFFVRCVVNSQDLKPTASRESLFADDTLADAREELGNCIRKYLITLAEEDPESFNRLIAVHYRSIKALATDDIDFFRIVINLLPFETTLGQLTLPQCREHDLILRFTPTYDQFGQIASVAAAQGLCVINAGYSYDLDLLRNYSELYPGHQVREIDANSLVESFEDLTRDEATETAELRRFADEVLEPFGSCCLVQKFKPEQLPSLFTTNESANFLRSIQGAKDESDELWSSVLDSIAQQPKTSAESQVILNYSNKLIRKIALCNDKDLVSRILQLLYVQSVILGRHPLRPQETALLSDGLLDLIDYSLGQHG